MIKIKFDNKTRNTYIMHNWCVEHFGMSGDWILYPDNIDKFDVSYLGAWAPDRWISILFPKNMFGDTYFLFRDAEDAAFFALKWC